MSQDSKTCGDCSGNKAALSTPQPESGVQGEAIHVSVFNVPQMDCPSEENLIRTAFTNFDEPVTFEFDILNRKVRVYHQVMVEKVSQTMSSVGLGAKLESLETVDRETLQQAQDAAVSSEVQDARILRWLLAINAIMFAIEFGVGIVAQSTGLIADSLDMWADAAVYGAALYAVGKAARLKLKVAHFSGWLQLILSLGVLFEVVRRAIYGSEPVSTLMMSMGSVALLANIICLMLIYKSRNRDAHMKASWIFSANDVLANTGVIIAGILVAMTESQLPDLIIGILISLIVLKGARHILLLT